MESRARELRSTLLGLQARIERDLAARQTNPAVRRMILNTAIGKEEAAVELRTGQPVAESQYEKRVERSQPQKVIVRLK